MENIIGNIVLDEGKMIVNSKEAKLYDKINEIIDHLNTQPQTEEKGKEIFDDFIKQFNDLQWKEKDTPEECLNFGGHTTSFERGTWKRETPEELTEEELKWGDKSHLKYREENPEEWDREELRKIREVMDTQLDWLFLEFKMLLNEREEKAREEGIREAKDIFQQAFKESLSSGNNDLDANTDARRVLYGFVSKLNNKKK